MSPISRKYKPAGSQAKRITFGKGLSLNWKQLLLLQQGFWEYQSSITVPPQLELEEAFFG